MKFAIVIPDGCADEPQDSLDGRTPLAAAHTPSMDRIAAEGIVGRASNVPAHLPAGSEVANMSLLGYDPEEYFSGRAPLEAAAKGIHVGKNDWAIRCNLVTITNQIMEDFTADHISTEEAAELLHSMANTVGDDHFEFVVGVSYRNLVIYRGDKGEAPFSSETRSRAPHDLIGQSITDEFPRGPGSDRLCQLMSQSHEVFADHAVNRGRIAAGSKPATDIWLWGVGQSPDLPSFQEQYGKTGVMITAVDLLRGLGRLIGWEIREVPGATGYLDTDYAAKGQAAIDAFHEHDVVCVHIEAPDEASHEGRLDAKIKALESIDSDIVLPIDKYLREQGDYRILISPDHPTPVRTRMHSHGDVPWTIGGTGIAADSFAEYSEVNAAASTHAFTEGFRLMEFFMNPRLS